MKRKVFAWEPWLFMTFGLFHLHRIWALIDRNSYARFWIGALENRGPFYFVLMGILAALCILGVTAFVKNRRVNYWWRWIYLLGGFAFVLGIKLLIQEKGKFPLIGPDEQNGCPPIPDGKDRDHDHGFI